MMPPLVESALTRRFVLGPIIALALVGANPTSSSFTLPGAASPSASASASPGSDVAAIARVLVLAHEAEGVYFVDNFVYAAAVGEELAQLKMIEPKIAWGTQVVVELPAAESVDGEVVILRAPIPGGGSLCMSEVSQVEDAGTWYARVAGPSKCPPHRPGMPGWTEDRAAGWA